MAHVPQDLAEAISDAGGASYVPFGTAPPLSLSDSKLQVTLTITPSVDLYRISSFGVLMTRQEPPC